MSNGKSTICQGGKPITKMLVMMKMTKAIQKSIKLIVMLEIGKIILGKYTLVRMLELATRELLTSVITDESSCQKITTDVTVMKLEEMELSLLMSRLSAPKMILFTSGLMILQLNPSQVCLYRTFKSLKLKCLIRLL